MTEEEELALALQASAAEAGSSQPEAAPAQPAVADPRANGHSSVPEAAEEPMQGQGQPGDPAAASSAVPSASEVSGVNALHLLLHGCLLLLSLLCSYPTR